MKWFNKAKRISPNRHSIEPCSSRNSDTFWPVVGAVCFKFNSLTLLMAQKCIAGQRPISLPCPGMAQAYPYFWGFLHYFDTLCPCNFISLHFFFPSKNFFISIPFFLSTFDQLNFRKIFHKSNIASWFRLWSLNCRGFNPFPT